MSTTTELATEKWVEYFDAIAEGVEESLVTIEVMSEELGDQTDVTRLPLQAIGYDPKDDVLEISVGGRSVHYPVVLRHFISAPRTISVEESSPLRPVSMLVTDASGVRTLIRLFKAAALES
ncbi:MAG: DUF5335 family protein [Solirubrobacteraceae bacterium]|jgi:hypothetical protein